MEAFQRFFNDSVNDASSPTLRWRVKPYKTVWMERDYLKKKKKETKDWVGHNGQWSELVAECLVWSYSICGVKADDVLSVT